MKVHASLAGWAISGAASLPQRVDVLDHRSSVQWVPLNAPDPAGMLRFFQAVEKYQNEAQLISLFSHGDSVLDGQHRKSAMLAAAGEYAAERWDWGALSAAEQERVTSSILEDIRRFVSLLRVGSFGAHSGWVVGHAPAPSERLINTLTLAPCAPPVEPSPIIEGPTARVA